ncbi:MAG: hypothetical protein AAF266_02785 [Planctomycetota bacterium]
MLRSRSRHRLAALLTLAASAVTASAGDPLVYEPNVDPRVGFNLVSWWNFGGNGENTWRNAVRDVHDAGFTEVSISPVRYINQGSGSIATSSQRGPELSHLAAGIAEAKSLGMTVTVNPFVELENFAFWRGQYNPTPGSAGSNTFWADYEDYLVDVAGIAEANGADAMNVGTELRAIVRNSGNRDRWTSVIDAVDGVFTGDLGYAANWDNYTNNNLRSAIWDHPAIDYVGIDSYFRNTTTNSQADASGADPNETFIAQVEAGWNDRLDNEILPYAAGLRSGEGLPVVFTEIGYLPYNRTAVNPQNESGPIDTAEQVMTFQGLQRALDGRQDELSAIHIWQWGMPGSNDSRWNINDSSPLDQPNNLPLGQWLSSFVSAPVLAGDFNGDGVLNAIDYTAWRDDGGTLLGISDYLTWTDFYGTTLGELEDSVSVPEPATCALLCLAVVAFRSRKPRPRV